MDAGRPPLLDESGLAEYRAQGFVNGGRLLDDTVADEVFGIIDRIVTDPTDPQHGNVHDMGIDGRPLLHLKDLWADHRIVREIIEMQEIASMLHQITGGTRFNLWQDGFFYKPPHVGSAHGWHQDSPYIPVSPVAGTAIWVALTDVLDAASGPMVMVPGSHRWGDATAKLEPLGPPPGLGSGIRTPQGTPIPDAVTCLVPKGSVHVHDGLTWHGSLANDGPTTRCGLLLIYVDGDAEIDGANPHVGKYPNEGPGQLDPDLHPVLVLDPTRLANL